MNRDNCGVLLQSPEQVSPTAWRDWSAQPYNRHAGKNKPSCCCAGTVAYVLPGDFDSNIYILTALRQMITDCEVFKNIFCHPETSKSFTVVDSSELTVWTYSNEACRKGFAQGQKLETSACEETAECRRYTSILHGWK